MCATGPWFLSFFSTPTLLTWLLFSWLIPLLFLSCSSYVAPRPHLIHSFSSVLPFPPVPFFFALPLSCLHRGHISTMFWVLAKHLASKPIHPAGQYVCSYNVCTQSTLATACSSCQIQITGQRESELHCSSKKPHFRGFILFTRHSRRREEHNLFNSLSWQHRKWWRFLKELKDKEMAP